MPQQAGSATGSAREGIANAALEMLGEAGLDDLVRVLTPERLATVGSWSPSTVRYHFGGRRDEDGPRDFAFRRRKLALAVLDLVVERTEESTEAAIERWRAAIDDLPIDQDLDGVLRAVVDNIASFVPGASEDDISARDRAYHLAVAVADEDPDAARLLRASRQRQIAAWAPALRAFLDAVGLELRPEQRIEDLANALYALFDGHLLRLRFDPTSRAPWFADVMFAVIESFTAPRGDGSAGSLVRRPRA
ncbi:hypothetical protein AB0L40_02265 [Patulibacter sp. NPDC049589]|uniref:hypothetical protein n=1 Tax=Patulibacter sp. NPDC049589 TaxID=3154731 RepID=UPI0034229B8C